MGLEDCRYAVPQAPSVTRNAQSSEHYKHAGDAGTDEHVPFLVQLEKIHCFIFKVRKVFFSLPQCNKYVLIKNYKK
jgi:hypothetical protein